MFWSRVDDEISGLSASETRHETTVNEEPLEEARPAGELGRSDFIYRRPEAYNNNEISNLLPMASQIPFLLEVYSERVHYVTGVPHMPTLRKIPRLRSRKDAQTISADEDALVFSVFYTAICSLDDEEVTTSFNLPKSKLAADYRKGMEMSLAKADFLSNPSDNIVQALLIFLTLARLHESTRYLWMMTGIVIRMARFLRFHEDGMSSKNVSPFTAEMQRRIWWNLCALDLRSTEDQGTELAIPRGSFSTRIPSNIHDTDMWPDMEHAPTELKTLTGTSLLRLCSKVTRGTQDMIAAGHTATIQEQIGLLDRLTQELDQAYFSVTNQSQHHAYLAAAGTMRVFLGRLTLLAFLPALFSSPNAEVSTEIRNKLLVAAIEIAELNHGLNTHPDCQLWRWVYQTQQHWHAVVFLLIEMCRRPWSAMVERAWLALQSPWLLPARAVSYKNPTIWVPLKKLMATAKSNRDNELDRLRSDPEAARALERADREQMPISSSSVTFPMYYNEEMFYRRWRDTIDRQTATNDRAGGTSSTTAARWNTAASSQGGQRVQQSQDAAYFSANDCSIPSQSGLGTAMDTADFGNLDSFLGDDLEMGDLDFMDDRDFLDFDWNGWLASANNL